MWTIYREPFPRPVHLRDAQFPDQCKDPGQIRNAYTLALDRPVSTSETHHGGSFSLRRNADLKVI